MEASRKIIIGINILLFIPILFLFVIVNSTFGNYTTSVYDIFMYPILIVAYITLSFILVKLSTRHVRNKKLYYLFLIPLLFWLISFLNGTNFYKNNILEGSVYNSYIIFFDNDTFEIRIQSYHVAQYIKGHYKKMGQSLLLENTEIKTLTNNRYTNKYQIIKDSILKPITNGFQDIVIKRQ